MEVYWKEGDKIINAALPKIKSHLPKVRTHILLVDDISQTGGTISETKKRLEKKLKYIDPTIRVAVIVVMNKSCKKLADDKELEGDFWREQFYCYPDEKKEVKFPWEI